jgi:uncharacterized membrane protein YvlD (DUF360 family)
MFTSLLPGLRELRAPLAAGYLWLAAGWLYFAPQLPASVEDAQGVLRDVYRVVAAGDPVAVVAGLTFIAYLLGMLSTDLLIRPVRFIVKLPLYILLLPFAIPLIVSVMLSTESPIMESKLNNLFAAIRAVRLRYQVTRATSPLIRAEQLVLRRLANKILTDEDYRAIFLGRLGERLEWILSRGSMTPGSEGLRRLQFVRDLISDSSVEDEEKAKEIVERLSKYVDEGYLEAAEALADSVVSIDRHAHDILGELFLVPERLVGDRPATYERWDRLRAESEFRQAVVPPVIAIIGVLVVEGVLSWPLVLLLLVPPITILVQGMRKEKEADGQLIQALEADVISIAAIDRLGTRDLYWFHTPGHWGVFFEGDHGWPPS